MASRRRQIRDTGIPWVREHQNKADLCGWDGGAQSVWPPGDTRLHPGWRGPARTGKTQVPHWGAGRTGRPSILETHEQPARQAISLGGSAIVLISILALCGCATGSQSATSPSTIATNTGAEAPSPTAAAVPTLGQVWGESQQGYGQVRPTSIFNGGDPTGSVSNVAWQSWGGAQATGTGTAEYVAPGQIVATGTQETATVVAFDLGACQGKFMYQAIEWYFPEEGQTYDPSNYIDICTGTYVSNGSSPGFG